MKHSFTFRLLLGANLLLLGWLVLGLIRAPSFKTKLSFIGIGRTQPAEGDEAALAGAATGPTAPHSPDNRSTSETPFSQIYSTDPKTFAANLRAIRCPEETINDILTAEVHRRFRQKVSTAPEAQTASETGTGVTNALAGQAHRGLDWAQVETWDYKQYVRNLRAMGFPEDLVRSILIADIDKLYEPREAPLKPKLVAHDAPLSQRATFNINVEDWQRVKDLWQLWIEKQSVLEQILESYVPREILRTPLSRNFEAYEYAISLLPPEKRNAVQVAQETEILVEGMNKTSIQDHAAELEAFKQSCGARDEALLQVLTPEEFERYEMNTTPAGTELARRVIGMQPTEEEFLAMFRIAYKNWLDTGGVYGRWRANPVPAEQIVAADQEMNGSLKQALGLDRFLDYQMAVSRTGQQLRNFAARFELSRDVLTQAFELQTQIEHILRGDVTRADPTASTANLQPTEQLAQVQTQLQDLLGPQLWEAWESGRNLRVNLDP